jgi:hypothetical protein
MSSIPAAEYFGYLPGDRSIRSIAREQELPYTHKKMASLFVKRIVMKRRADWKSREGAGCLVCFKMFSG